MSTIASRVIVIFRSSTALDVFPTEPVFLQALEQLPEVDKVILYDVNDLEEMISLFISHEFSPNSVVQLIIQGHGRSNLLELGEEVIQVGHDSFCQFCGFLREFVIPTLTVTGSIFLHGCSLGREGRQPSFARLVSQDLPNHLVLASSKDIHMGDLELGSSPVISICYNVTPEESRTGYEILQYLKGEIFSAIDDIDCINSEHLEELTRFSEQRVSH